MVPQREIDRVYSALEKIEPDKVDLIEEYILEEEKYSENNLFRTKSKSVGLSDYDLDLSLSILICSCNCILFFNSLDIFSCE